jgi:hypothetical protein
LLPSSAAAETLELAITFLLQQVEAQDLQPLTFASHTYDSFHLLMPLYGELPCW